MPKVVWTRRARTDLKSIHDHITLDAPLTAAAYTKRLMRAVSILRHSPYIGAIVPELNRENVREIIRGNYRIIYAVEAKSVTVLSVHHAARLLDADSFDD
jgi:toxin ParE1/3/4